MMKATWITICFLIAVVASADMSSADFYDLDIETRKIYLQGVIEGIELSRVLCQQHRCSDIFMIASLTVAEVYEFLSVDTLEPVILSRIVKYIRRYYGYSTN
tara:strand:- start:231 stop:536 length:306 start_codon:yes stop_codon:yes gene_type:complete